MFDLQKLKREWKTFALAVATAVIGAWDAISAWGYDYSTVIPENYRPYVIPGLGIGFLVLRRYKSEAVVEKTVETTTVETVKTKDPEGGDGVAA